MIYIYSVYCLTIHHEGYRVDLIYGNGILRHIAGLVGQNNGVLLIIRRDHKFTLGQSHILIIHLHGIQILLDYRKCLIAVVAGTILDTIDHRNSGIKYHAIGADIANISCIVYQLGIYYIIIVRVQSESVMVSDPFRDGLYLFFCQDLIRQIVVDSVHTAAGIVGCDGNGLALLKEDTKGDRIQEFLPTVIFHCDLTGRSCHILDTFHDDTDIFRHDNGVNTSLCRCFFTIYIYSKLCCGHITLGDLYLEGKLTAMLDTCGLAADDGITGHLRRQSHFVGIDGVRCGHSHITGHIGQFGHRLAIHGPYRSRLIISCLARDRRELCTCQICAVIYFHSVYCLTICHKGYAVDLVYRHGITCLIASLVGQFNNVLFIVCRDHEAAFRQSHILAIHFQGIQVFLHYLEGLIAIIAAAILDIGDHRSRSVKYHTIRADVYDIAGVIDCLHIDHSTAVRIQGKAAGIGCPGLNGFHLIQGQLSLRNIIEYFLYTTASILCRDGCRLALLEEDTKTDRIQEISPCVVYHSDRSGGSSNICHAYYFYILGRINLSNGIYTVVCSQNHAIGHYGKVFGSSISFGDLHGKVEILSVRYHHGFIGMQRIAVSYGKGDLVVFLQIFLAKDYGRIHQTIVGLQQTMGRRIGKQLVIFQCDGTVQHGHIPLDLSTDLTGLRDHHRLITCYETQFHITHAAGRKDRIGHILTVKVNGKIQTFRTGNGIVQMETLHCTLIAGGIHAVYGQNLIQFGLVQHYRDAEAAGFIYSNFCCLGAFQRYDHGSTGLGQTNYMDCFFCIIIVTAAKYLTIDGSTDLQGRTGAVHTETILHLEAITGCIFTGQSQHMLTLGHVFCQGNSATVGSVPDTGLYTAIQRPAAGYFHIRADLEGNLCIGHYIDGTAIRIDHRTDRLGSYCLDSHFRRIRSNHSHFIRNHFSGVNRQTRYIVLVSGNANTIGLAVFQCMDRLDHGRTAVF